MENYNFISYRDIIDNIVKYYNLEQCTWYIPINNHVSICQIKAFFIIMNIITLSRTMRMSLLSSVVQKSIFFSFQITYDLVLT